MELSPGTGTPESGGLTASQALIIMETLGAHDAVGAADLTEVALKHDASEGTQRLAAYLLVTLLKRQFVESESDR
jgi:agmatinase